MRLGLGWNWIERTITERRAEGMRRKFHALYRDLGGGLDFESEFREAVNSIGYVTVALFAPALKKRIYADIVRGEEANAYVSVENGRYFVAVTDGVVSGVHTKIGRVLEMSWSNEVDRSRVHHFLSAYAIQFSIAHECGHIVLGHLEPRGRKGYFTMAERPSSRVAEFLRVPFLEELECDAIAVASLIAVLHMVWHEEESPYRRDAEFLGPRMFLALLGSSLMTLVHSVYVDGHRAALPEQTLREICVRVLAIYWQVQDGVETVFEAGSGYALSEDDKMFAFNNVLIPAVRTLDARLMQTIDNEGPAIRDEVQRALAIIDPKTANIVERLVNL